MNFKLRRSGPFFESANQTIFQPISSYILDKTDKMKFRIFFIVLYLFINLNTFAQPYGNDENSYKNFPLVCLSWEEIELYELINQYRKRHHLPAIPLSTCLTYVAQRHARDLAENYKFDEFCNLHSWSENDNWSSCCYDSDHRNVKCMWSKPEELTGFDGYGYEIAYWNNFSYNDMSRIADDALSAWKKSKGHHTVIINRSTWKDLKWKAIGIGIYEGFVLVWFSDQNDDLPVPGICVE